MKELGIGNWELGIGNWELGIGKIPIVSDPVKCFFFASSLHLNPLRPLRSLRFNFFNDLLRS
jgi:hypothetical protein